MTLNEFLAYATLVVTWYGGGFAVFSPPLAWGGVAVGYWMNRGYPFASRLAGALLAATVGAAIAQMWRVSGTAPPVLDLSARVIAVVASLARPAVSAFYPGGTVFVVAAVVFYAPFVLGLLLCIVARRYEEGIADAAKNFRERLAERRAVRQAKWAEKAKENRALAEKHAQTRAALPVEPVEAEALPRFNLNTSTPAAGVPVVQAASGEPVALPPEITANGRPVVIVIKLEPPTANVLRVPRGSVSGFFVGSFYALRIVSELWVPLLVVFLWFYGPALLAYETRQLTDALATIARALRPW